MNTIHVRSVLAFIIIAIGGMLAVGPRCMATVYDSNGTAESVRFIHDYHAQDGDTITLPAGMFHWSTPNPVLNITKAITLSGAGIGKTIIVDDMTSGKLMQWTLRSNSVSRMTGIEIQYGGHRSNFQGGPGGVIHIDGRNDDGSQFRFDHNKYNHSMGLIVPDTVMGVFDHNEFVHIAAGTFIIYGSHWDGQPNGYDYSWHEPVNFGTSQFTFIEDNTITNLSTTSPTYFTDALAGARFVIRYNNFLGAVISDHGSESSGRQRGSRAFEVYNNTFNGNHLSANLGGSRSSRVILHDNQIANYSSATFNLNAFRNHWSFANSFFDGMNGTNPWDVNDTTGGPSHNGIYYSGTAAAANSNVTVTVSGNPGWSTNQWVGYVLRRLTDNCNRGTINFGEIRGSTANTLTYTASDYGPNMALCAGDSLEIRKVVQAFDAPGRGQGSLLLHTASPTRIPGGQDQVTEPNYMWNNAPQSITFQPSTGTIRAGEHFFNNTAMPGYTPFTYPHPLVTGAARAVVADFNGDGSRDFVLQNASTHQTAIWYLSGVTLLGGLYGPTLPAGWGLKGAADFNRDSHPDYALFAPNAHQTAMWYLSGPTWIASAYGPTVPSGWELVATGDFNGDGSPDYLLYNASTRQTAIWFLNNNVFISGVYGSTLVAGWDLVGVADFNRDGYLDYTLFNPITGETAIWYLSGPTCIGGDWGPTVPSDWILVAAAEFNGDGHPDYVLYNPSTRQTAIWYMNNNVHVSGAFGPTLPPGWSLIAP